jgi:tetratricopeptide (TPR) repeat protein
MVSLLVAVVPSYTANEDDAVRSITAALRAKHFQEALNLAQAARRTSPKEIRILVLEGMALTGLHKDGKALAAFKSAIEISPDYVPAIEAAAEIEYRQGNPEAVTYLHRLLALRPGEPRTRCSARWHGSSQIAPPRCSISRWQSRRSPPSPTLCENSAPVC